MWPFESAWTAPTVIARHAHRTGRNHQGPPQGRYDAITRMELMSSADDASSIDEVPEVARGTLIQERQWFNYLIGVEATPFGIYIDHTPLDSSYPSTSHSAPQPAGNAATSVEAPLVTIEEVDEESLCESASSSGNTTSVEQESIDKADDKQVSERDQPPPASPALDDSAAYRSVSFEGNSDVSVSGAATGDRSSIYKEGGLPGRLAYGSDGTRQDRGKPRRSQTASKNDASSVTSSSSSVSSKGGGRAESVISNHVDSRLEEAWHTSLDNLALDYRDFCSRTAQIMEASGYRAKRKHIMFGLPAPLLAAIVTLVSSLWLDPRAVYLVSILSGFAAICSAVHTFFDLGGRAQLFWNYSAYYGALCTKIDVTLARNKAWRTPPDQFFGEIRFELQHLNSTAPQPPGSGCCGTVYGETIAPPAPPRRIQCTR